jgi:Zn-dependent peptidase ImmA (M78 family)
MLFTEVYTINDVKKILQNMAIEHGLNNIPNLVLCDDINSYGKFKRSNNTIYLNVNKLTLKRFFYTIAHELYHSNDYCYDSKELREFRAELFGLLYIK